MVKIEELCAEIVRRYRSEIAQFYYLNMRSCSCLVHYTFDQAYEKIEDLIGHLNTNTCVAYGAFDGDEIVGYVWAYIHPFREETRMYINEIRVKEEYRGQGIGKKMLGLVEDRAREYGLPALYLHAEASNPEAVRLYESAGYFKERIQLRKEIIQDRN